MTIATAEKHLYKTDKHIHTHKKRYLEVISRSTRFKEFNREKKTATKTSNMFKIVTRIGTCDAGFSSVKFVSETGTQIKFEGKI